MRTDQDMLACILNAAKSDERVRLVTLEGSRTNPNIAPDPFRDFDISFFVTELDSFKSNDAWLDVFGERLMMQKPEDMELFPPELGNWFSYLMIMADGHKLDLTLIPLNETEAYFEDSDGLVRVLLDKDGRAAKQQQTAPTDQSYWIKPPTARSFDDCCNEFWFVATYVVKGLARKEILFAADHMNNISRPNLLRMMSWQIGAEQGYSFSVGKNYKFIDRFLPEEDWQALLSSYSQHGYKEMWSSLFVIYDLFRKYAKAVASRQGYPYPPYDEVITEYTERIHRDLKHR
ncbi:aminoglycoside 6-adenylyltransferase [Paenibacillus sp. JJ-223]|uniref:aminoglycoside 6-adenylyltransferase n=1 Tax=Paenibacillus sp. JJ-223 TaxID=2905647 RepID=UPI001F161AA1|nr:aminoglycoside 6-adenylyltransferase [Paenibacillus sp. JJ-223]CAH1207101.1 Aminoglycoside 6-adenylyltransferase [Paenibacillus sp. JJ-223]